MNVPPAKSLCLGESAHRWPAEQLSQAHSWRNTGQLGLSSIWQRTRRKIRKLKMNSYSLLFFTIETVMQLPHPFRFLLLSSFLHPSSSHTLLHAVLTAASETRLGIPEQVWCWTQRKGIHILQEAHRLQIYIESCSVSITVLLRVTYRGLTTKTIVSPSKSHTALNSQIKNQPRVIWSWEWHPVACKKKFRSQSSPVTQQTGQGKLCPVSQP